VPDFLAQGGRFGIGSDSNVRISAADELRTLEYGQRLIHRRRNVLGAANQSTGQRLFDAALAGGWQAVGATDDATVTLEESLDHWLFSTDNAAIVSVERGGVRLVEGGRHRDRDRIAARYRKTLAGLLG
jgi:formimidoylglutamate deiminase